MDPEAPNDPPDGASAGWYPDPSGRFGRRYFDGEWTEHVAGARPAAARASAEPDPAPGADAAVVHRPAGRRLGWYGLAVAAAGIVLAALSVTVLRWSGDATFGDIRKISDQWEASTYDDARLAYHYGAWGWILLLALVVAGVLLVAAAVDRGDGTGLRFVVAAIAAAGVVGHAAYVAKVFAGPGPSPGSDAWAGSMGYLIVIVGLAIATPRRRTTA